MEYNLKISLGKIFLITFLIFPAVYGQMSKFQSNNPGINYNESIVINVSNNDLLYFWISNKSLLLSRSTNNGQSWTDSVYLALNGVDNLNAFTTASGRIVLFYYNHVCLSQFSDDNGKTWSSPISMNLGYNIKNGILSQSSSGKLFYVFNKLYNTGITKDIFYITSTDNGTTWSAIKLFANGPSFGNIVYISGSKLMMVYQNQGFNYSLSTDDGISWGSPTLIDSNSSINTPRIIKDQSGKLWLFYQELFSTHFPGKTEQDIMYRTSVDDGATWGNENYFTLFKDFDGYYSISSNGNNPLVSFASNRGDSLIVQNSIWFGRAGITNDDNAPASLYKYNISPDADPGHQYVLDAYIGNYAPISSVKCMSILTGVIQPSITMYDDGTHGDTTANDFIYTCLLPAVNIGDIMTTSIVIADQQLDTVIFVGPVVAIPLNNSIASASIEVNRFKVPINNVGALGGFLINNIYSSEGTYDGNTVLFNAGILMSGKSNGFLWSNGSFVASRIEDYVPGKIGTNPLDPRNIIYVIRASDPLFGQSWQLWKIAVSQGADFYDGNHDGIYNPIDLNGNGKWDPDEDRPDLLGDITAWCVYNDGLPAYQRIYSDVNPQGIEIQQTVFAQKDSADLNNVIFVRYRLINNGSAAQVIDSVFFGTAADIDIGDNGSNDLVGCDTLLNSGYIYHHLGAGDTKFGTNPPAEFITQIQGPLSYIPGSTFSDINGNGIYDSGIDNPIDTGYSFLGPVLGKNIYPGAKNLNMSSSFQFYGGIDPANRIQAYYYLNGRDYHGYYINPCTWAHGEVLGGQNCANINPAFMYSGDPVNQTGWLNKIAQDQRIITSSGPFKLVKDKPVDIIIAHLVGRGSDPINSISVAKSYAATTINYCKSNFPNSIINGVNDLPNTVNNFRLDQNYPNPFNPSTKIRFSINTNSQVTIKIINILGKEIATILNEQKHSGEYTIDFNAGKYNLASGVYFYKLTAGSFTSVKKMMLLK